MSAAAASTASFTCEICNAHFMRQSSLTRHKVLCEFKCQTAKNVQAEIDRFCDLPSHAKLVDIVRELVVRQTKTEAQLKELNQWVSQKKRRFDALKWLRVNQIPAVRFSEWIQHEWGGTTSLAIDALDEMVAELASEPLWMVIHKRIQPVLTASTTTAAASTTTSATATTSIATPILPLACFSHNPTTFYIYEPNATMRDWRRMEFADFVSLLKKIQNRLLNQLVQWKTAHQHEFHTSSGFADQFAKAAGKLSGMRLEPDPNWSKLRSKIAETIKMDIGLASALTALCDDGDHPMDII